MATHSRDIERIPEVLSMLRIFWLQHSDLRLGQILALAASKYGVDPFYLEEREFIAALGRLLMENG